MNCKSKQEWILDYLDGSLTLSAKENAEKHLAACAECSKAAKELTHANSLVRMLPRVQASENFDQSLADRIAIAKVKSQKSSWLPSLQLPRIVPISALKPAFALGAAAFAVAGLVFYHPAAPQQASSSNDTALIAQCVAIHQKDVASQPLADSAGQYHSGWNGDSASDSAAESL